LFLAFPWLFPGGIGDIKESREYDIDIADWAQNLFFYKDGRFDKDNLWCFFVLNYIQRHRNKSQSRWFVSDFVGDFPQTWMYFKQNYLMVINLLLTS
jgi:hypothetical protein